MAKKALGKAMLELVAAVEESLGDRTGHLLVGCSGGADSLSLAAATAVVAKRRGLLARALVIDHGLQEDSAEVAKKAASRAEKVGLSADIVPVEVVPDGTGPEACARAARHEALDEVAEALDAVVLLGHTLDDQAESVLLGLARGSGARSLAGMAPSRDRFLRPFLGVRRAVTEAACEELGTKYWSDPHNSSDEFARSRVRNKVLPVMEDKLGPGIAEALARTALLLRDDADALDAIAAEQVADVDLRGDLPVSALPGLPALRRRILRRWLLAHGAQEPAYAHTVAVEQLVTDWHGQKWVEVPGLKVARHANRLMILQG